MPHHHAFILALPPDTPADSEPGSSGTAPSAHAVNGLGLIFGILLIVVILVMALAVLTMARRGAAVTRLRQERARRTRLGRRNAWEEAGQRARPEPTTESDDDVPTS
ncbi:MAG: hypothetical protein KDA21_12930 [Phycisphaerales bacterium]|nr:hypothetical protein [Phycisphaerales bacterium]